MTDLRVGFGYDSHRLEEGNNLIIGGVNIPYFKGCVAHSDGDVLIHAIIDATLGALGMKDIGTLFPDNDPKYKNIKSTKLLEQIFIDINSKKWKINQIDSTIILEQPKLSPYIDEMKQKLANILLMPKNNISIKAKTNEKIGEIGNGNGIIAMSVVTCIKI